MIVGLSLRVGWEVASTLDLEVHRILINLVREILASNLLSARAKRGEKEGVVGCDSLEFANHLAKLSEYQSTAHRCGDIKYSACRVYVDGRECAEAMTRKRTSGLISSSYLPNCF